MFDPDGDGPVAGNVRFEWDALDWFERVGDAVHRDLAWTYNYPMSQVAPIARLIAFYNEKR